ncbi:NB-ARC domain-containing disease resistance protein [Zostera marina]|uniref:NB-ARC domain-containing disease resistance protein n=1 Tax=Zostera marina TaxID=29655 RepID=A0A0K9NP78_ZOSMR|nr:NB-ARC domain-containing disease resistance protein [Zostera marina]
MAELQLGGSVLGALLEVVFDKFSSEAIRRMGSMREIEDDIFKLRITLRKIKSMLVSAEEHKVEDLKEWIDKVRDVTYMVEDFLDELELAHVQRDEESGTLRSLMPRFAHDLIDSSNIQDIQRKVDRVLHLAEYYDLKKSENIVKKLEWRETSSILDDEMVIGRDAVKTQMIQMLMSESTKEESYDVIPIIGMGGVGKTTLAQFIYNNIDVEKHFQLRIWVCVSDDFDKKRLTREIIKSICNQSQGKSIKTKIDNFNDDNWDALQTKLKELLVKGGRFLLVLDDMWEEQAKKWEEFKKPFKFGQKGSRILVTTRKKIVVKMVSEKEIKLEGLLDADLWTLFEKIAFEGSYSKSIILEEIGREITNKLKGSPLAAKTVGKLLNGDFDVAYWNEILESELWNLSQNESDIMPALLLSYQQLPECLKPCFAFFSLFPKDHIFNRDELIRMWSAHNWIKDEGKKSKEDVGKKYLNALLGRCMIDTHKKRHYQGTKDFYVMHDLIHDLTLFVSNNEYFCIKNEADLLHIPSSVRHLSVYGSKAIQFEPIHYQNLNNLRTLIFLSTDCKCDLDVLFDRAKKLHLLKVRDILDTDVSDSIQQLIHLRYLDLDSNQIRSIPDSLCKLHFLQVLILKYCPLQKLPTGLNTIANLQYLKLPHNQFFDSDIKSVGNLRLLQKLQFQVSNKSGHTIAELKNMNELRKLYIRNLEIVCSKKNAMEGNLKEKNHLEILELFWNNDNGSRNNDVTDDVIEGLQPPNNISDLRIFFYDGIKSPSWIENQSLSYLKHIAIIGCKSWTIDFSFGHLSHLVSLYIDGMKAVQQLGPKFFGEGAVTGFPSLEVLRIKNMENWKEWRISVDNHNTQIFPCLKILEISDCTKLNGIPFKIPSTLSFLRIFSSPNLASISVLPPSIKHLVICKCEKVFNSFSSTHLEGLTSLESLIIADYPHLKLLPQSLKVIKELYIYNCPELKLESWMQDLTILHLYICNCPKAIESLLKEHIVMPPSLTFLKLEAGFSCNLVDVDVTLATYHNLPFLRQFCIGQFRSASLSNWIQNLSLLSKLTFYDCQDLESLNFQFLVKLKYLSISNCPKLSVSSTRLQSQLQLEKFKISAVSMVQLKEWLIFVSNTSPELKKLFIFKCPELIDFDVDMNNALLKLPKLKKLDLSRCKSCKSLPTLLHKFTSLETIIIHDCANIHSLSENGFPSSLLDLHINKCPKLREQCKIEGVEWHKISHIRNIVIDWEKIRWISNLPTQMSVQRFSLPTENDARLAFGIKDPR